MCNHATKPAENSQVNTQATRYQCLFNLLKRTPQGTRVICQDLTFDQVCSLINEIPGALVKFSKMEAML